MLIDSHCHIEDDETALFAYTNGVEGLLNAGKDVDESAKQLAMCARFKKNHELGQAVPLVWTSAGVHPDSAPQKLSHITTATLCQAAQNPFVIAIGECGLDYHYGAAYKSQQKEMFARHIEAAGISGLPLMIHQRDAEADMLTLLRSGKQQYPHLAAVIHCFTATADFAAAVEAMGFYISASGIITFKSAQDVAEVFKHYPQDKILVETDSPYLAPVPFRGQQNQPAYVVQTAQKLAELRGLSLAAIGRITTANFYQLYQKAKGKEQHV